MVSFISWVDYSAAERQRMRRVHRYKGHAVRKNVADAFGKAFLAHWRPGQDPWLDKGSLSNEEIDSWMVKLEVSQT
jgi:hypothetical protein